MSADFIILSCPCCAGQLRVTEDADRFNCRHCGREHLVRRQGGIVNLVPFTQKLEHVARGMGRNASEMAIKRLKEDRRRIVREVEGWRRAGLQALNAELRLRYVRLGALFLAIPAGLLAVPMFFAGLPLGALLVAIALCIGSAAVFGLCTCFLPSRMEEVARTRRGFDRLRGELAECDAELDHHYEVVRV